MILIKDLGMCYPENGNKTRKYRIGLYSCPKCNKNEKRRISYMKNKKPKMCMSCYAKYNKNATKHGQRHTRLYKIWKGIKTRCYNSNEKIYRWYGAKGVTMCDEWKEDFIPFYSWAMANGYNDNLVIDKDKLCEELNIYPKIYSPKTCQWITKEENTKIRNGKA